jgi:hypothetical protein
MRFLPSEYQDMQKDMQSAGLDEKDFRSVKLQGKLNLFYLDQPAPFKFFRKKETRLGPGGKWENITIYLLYESGKAIEADGWEGVMKAFREWLANLE